MTTSRVPVPLIVWLALAPALAAAPRLPIAVSPGGEEQALRSESCPTFSWAPSRGGGFEIVVYGVTVEGRLAAEPTVRERLPAGATSWTLGTDRCLAPGRYAWTVRHLDSGTTEQAWARPRLLQVENAASPEMERQIERTVERMLERWLAEGKFARPAAPAPSPADAAAAPPAGPRSVAGAVLFDPPNCTEMPPLFGDVPNADPRCEFIKQLAATDDIASECAPGLFCPDNPVTRGQLAVYMVRAMRGTATWDALGESVEHTEIVDTTRAVNLPIGSFYNCSIGVPIVGGSPAGTAPNFVFGGGVVMGLAWDSDDTDNACASFVVPPDYVSGGTIRLIGEVGPTEDNDWTVSSLRFTPGSNGVIESNVVASNCDAGPGVSPVTYACDLVLPVVVANSGMTVGVRRSGGTDNMGLVAVEFRYQSRQ